MSVCHFEMVRFSYGDQLVLDDLSFSTRPGQILGLLGRNGAGKSTTFKLLMGLMSPHSGQIRFNERVIHRGDRNIRRDVGFLSDEHLFYPNFTVHENMGLFARLWDVDPHDAQLRARDLFTRFGLWDVQNHWAGKLSKGLKQKLSFCLALIHQPKFLVLDEPFSGLDITSVLETRAFIQELSKQGVSILFASHMPEEVEVLADRVLFLEQGAIARDLDRKQLSDQGGVVQVFKEVTGIQP